MKKGKRLIILLLCSTLITAHFTSGTYAKYTSSMDTTDTARTARWGINVENEVDLFKESVIKGLNGSSINDDNIIAPGTSGEYTFVISGTAETAYKIDIDAEVKDYTNSRIKCYLDDRYAGSGEEGINKLKGLLENLLSGTIYPAGHSLEKDGIHKIGWKWEYEEQMDDGNLYDAVDTDLGNKVDTYLKDATTSSEDFTPSENAPGVKMTVKITATQVES